MCYDDVEPDVRLNLADNMSVCTCGDALNRCLTFRKRLEKANYTLANTNLLTLFMDISFRRVKKVNLAVCKILFIRLAWSFG